jgi:hypothetical protein
VTRGRLAALAAAVAIGCAGAPASPAAPHVVVVTQVPAAATSGGVDPASRYPDGSRIARMDLARPAEAARPLSEGMTAAGGANVSWDAARIVFVGKEKPADRFAVWTAKADGSERVRVGCGSGEGAADCGSAAFLPDGRVVFSMSTPPSGAALFVTDAKGGAPRRITFSGGTDADPRVLRDGRIAYASRAPDAREFAPRTVHVDGTGVGPYAGSENGRALLAGHAAGVPADPAWRAVQCADLAPSRRPQGHLSVVDTTKSWGGVFCVDARPAGSPGARRVRFAVAAASPQVLGDVALESDGSFYVRVPPDTPLVLDVLDDDGVVVSAQTTPFWVRPGETRGCIGCHEEPDTTPPNVRPVAVLSNPIALGRVRTPEGSR